MPSGNQVRVQEKSQDPVGMQLGSVPQPKISAEYGGHPCGGRWGEGVALTLSPANKLPGSEDLLQAPALSNNAQIISLSVLQKLSVHPLLCVQVLPTSG